MCLELTKKAVNWAATVAFLGLLLTAGCGDSNRHAAGPRLGPADLGLPEGDCAATGYVILEPMRSTGRFPLALAVAKLKERAGANDEWQIASLKEEQATWWNSLFNTVPAVREVIVLGERSAGPSAAGMAGVVGKAKRLDARLCLIYGPAGSGPKEASLIGALYDTMTGRAVARIQTQASPADFQKRRPDGLSGDKRHVDPEYLAARKFEQQIRACVAELIKRDSPVTPPELMAPQTAPPGEQ